MRRILEIPVFALRDAHIESVFPGEEQLYSKVYGDFKLLEIDLDETYSVYIYVIHTLPDFGNFTLIDQIIPKVPFSLFVLDLDEGFDKTRLGHLFETYLQRYSTPAYFIAPKDEEGRHLRFNNEPMIVENDSHLFVYNRNDEKSIVKILTNAIEKTVEKTVQHEG